MMEEIFDKLRSLQDILSQKFEVERQIDDLPKALATKTELLNRLKQSYIQKNEDIENMKVKLKTTRFRVDEAETGREQSEKQMDLIKTQREYEALDKEIKDATVREQDLRKEMQDEDKLLEEMLGDLEREQDLIQKQEEEVKTEQSRIKHETKERTKVLQKLEKEESKIIPGLDEEILFKFERIIRSKSGVGIVPTVENICTGCHMILTPQFVNDVREGTDIRFCPFCSRILYFQEEEITTPSLDIFHMGEEDQPADESENSEEMDESEVVKETKGG